MFYAVKHVLFSPIYLLFSLPFSYPCISNFSFWVIFYLPFSVSFSTAVLESSVSETSFFTFFPEGCFCYVQSSGLYRVQILLPFFTLKLSSHCFASHYFCRAMNLMLLLVAGNLVFLSAFKIFLLPWVFSNSYV